MVMEINPYQAVIYFNTYIIKLVFFRCGIVILTIKEENEL